MEGSVLAGVGVGVARVLPQLAIKLRKKNDKGSKGVKPVFKGPVIWAV